MQLHQLGCKLKNLLLFHDLSCFYLLLQRCVKILFSLWHGSWLLTHIPHLLKKYFMKILLIDDDEMTLQIMSSNLSKKGHEVRTAVQGEAALESMRENKPDLVIADVMMPYMSGLEFLNIVNYEYMEDVKVMLMSSLQNDDIKELSIDLGAVDYISKPVNFVTLLPKIESIALRN